MKHYRRLLLVSIIVLTSIEAIPTYHFLQLFKPANNTQQIEGLIFNHYHEELSSPVHRLIYSVSISAISKSSLEIIKQSTNNAHVDSCCHGSQHIVLVIGESYNKHHSSLYGYKYGTTPNQQRRYLNNELTIFNDVVSPWNITSNVFLSLFSLWNCASGNDISNYPLFPILFKRSGYDVNFYSNQYVTKGLRRGSTNQTGSFFLSDAELCDSLFSHRNKKAHLYDKDFVCHIESNVKKPEWDNSYSFDIIHLIGQHFDYAKRYPDEYGMFSAEQYKNKNIENHARKIIADYDNATYYNDAVLDKILSIYEEDDAIVIFVADHGEEVYDCINSHGRLFQTPTWEIAHQEFEIPMWIWCSETYKQQHEDVVHRIQLACNRPFMTDDLPQILLDIAGIHCKWKDDTRNILSDTYKPKKRIIAGNVDYDELVNTITR